MSGPVRTDTLLTCTLLTGMLLVCASGCGRQPSATLSLQISAKSDDANNTVDAATFSTAHGGAVSCDGTRTTASVLRMRDAEMPSNALSYTYTHLEITLPPGTSLRTPATYHVGDPAVGIRYFEPAPMVMVRVWGATAGTIDVGGDVTVSISGAAMTTQGMPALGTFTLDGVFQLHGYDAKSCVID